MEKGSTLLEILLGLSLVIMLITACAFNSFTFNNNHVEMEIKTEEYVTLHRFAKCNAQLSGKKSKVIIENNKLNLVLEDFNGEISYIPSLQRHIDRLNNSVTFTGQSNVVTYMPDGSLENGGTIRMFLKSDNSESITIMINEWNKIKMIRSEPVDVLEDSGQFVEMQ